MMKIDTPEFRALFTPELNELSRLFLENGYEIRLAGGPVRDLLLGIEPKDLDFATNATPDQMKEIFEKNQVRMINNRGEQHGTVTPRIFDKENFEVTTLRIDVSTDGRHAEVQFTDDWKLDASRRDLTINSMFLGLDGILYDFFGGSSDLKERRVRFVGEADKRIKEDYLRILRYFRFYGRIATTPNSHDESTLQAIRDNASGLDIISGERIWSELKKILTGRYAADLIMCLLDTGCGPHVGLPKEVGGSSLSIVYSRLQGLEYEAMTLLSSILQDDSDVMHFHQRMKLSNFDRDLGFFIAENRGIKDNELLSLKTYQLLLADAKPERFKECRKWILELMKYQGANASLREEFEAWQMPRFPVNGHTLVQHKVPRGKLMSVVLSKLKNHWKDNDFNATLEELEKKIPDILREASGNDLNIEKDSAVSKRQRRS
ncbi:unnamed protein product [Notodromas monacha]|uniref:CCA tRNA nucleotidyltransferase 1, mitochondrial n=1 Tax=Notodromas monacha TaxID=399045 RepID=A0A7R9BND0_9CRUS|nr:unnamed protein product [Notodromas monacha]CAG0917859.1 unnamed protein product [Notodromas monacha]